MTSSVNAQSLYAFEATSLQGERVPLEQFRGQVLLIVNVASQCAFTPQYRELQSLYETYREQGFSVLGFPCNQFGGQEPGTSEEIADFCSISYDVTFPMFQRVDVNGSSAHPLFTYLKSAQPGLLGNAIKWNFTKFLISRTGQPVSRFAPITNPSKLPPAIEEQLAKSVVTT